MTKQGKKGTIIKEFILSGMEFISRVERINEAIEEKI